MSATTQTSLATSSIPYEWNETVLPLHAPKSEGGATIDLHTALPLERPGPPVARITTQNLGIDADVAQVLARPTNRIIAVNDVFHDPNDVDAHLTVDAGNHGVPTEKYYSDPETLPYIAELICLNREDELIRIANVVHEHRELLGRYAQESVDENPQSALWSIIPADIKNRLVELLDTTERVNLNNAARNQSISERDIDNPELPKNGPIYYIGVTDSGIEFAVTPLDTLRFIRDKLVAVFRVPEGIAWPVGEQFRSRLVALFGHLYPHKLEPVWEIGKDTSRELNQLIPGKNPNPYVGYIDSFHNRRIRVRNLKEFWDHVQSNAEDEIAYVAVGSKVIPCVVGTNLTSLPGGSHGIYLNPADHNNGGPGYIEFTRRLSDGAAIQGTWEEEGEENPSTKLDLRDRGLGVLVKVLSLEEGKKHLASQGS